MKKKQIQEDNLGYELLKRFVHYIYPKFYRQVEIRGLENIPDNEPVIFAGNHQNGVMDPLAIIIYQKEPIVYMARADIFQSPLNRALLRFIKVTPVYRIRDGFENLSKNDQQIKEAINILLDSKCLGVMPEGNHGENHRLRPLVKGLFRIGFQAEVQLENKAHVKIIPVGIDYSFYQHAGSDLVISYGKPIEIKEFLPSYLENPAVGLNAIRAALASALSSLMHDVRSDNYDRTYRLSCYGIPAYLAHQAENEIPTNATTMAGLHFDARVALTKIFDLLETEQPERIQQLDDLTKRLNQLPGFPNEIMEWMDEKPSPTSQAVLGILALLLLPGLTLNAPAWGISRLIIRKIEDKQMHSTFVFTQGMACNFVVYLAVSITLGYLFSTTLLQTLLLFVFIGALGVVSERTRQFLRLPCKKLLYSFGKRKMFVKACASDYRLLKKEIKKVLEERKASY